jgi:hypothetical protein
LNREVIIERRGTDGDMAAAIRLIEELDGQVDVFGLGGIDLYLIADDRRYVVRDALRMQRAARHTPVVDGSGLKHTLERQTVLWLHETGRVSFTGKKVLLVSGVDRFGMAEVLPQVGAITHYGDLVFALGVPVMLTSLTMLRTIAHLLLPIIVRLPFTLVYPTGGKQEQQATGHARHFAWADIIAGDFHYIRRYMPERMDGKVIITNTTTAADLALLRARGVHQLVSTTPEFDGRSFGTNVMEAVLVALAGKAPEAMTPEDYLHALAELHWTPRVVALQESGGG